MATKKPAAKKPAAKKPGTKGKGKKGGALGKRKFVAFTTKSGETIIRPVESVAKALGIKKLDASAKGKRGEDLKGSKGAKSVKVELKNGQIKQFPVPANANLKDVGDFLRKNVKNAVAYGYGSANRPLGKASGGTKKTPAKRR
jgi:hypothetical protein